MEKTTGVICTMEFGLELANQGRVMLWRVIDRPRFSIGRNPQCDLCVPDERVAPVHAVLVRDEQGLTLHSRSPDGVQVGDEPVHDSLRIAHDDVIQLGPLQARVRVLQEPARAAGRTRTLAAEKGPSGRVVVSLSESEPRAGAPPRSWSLESTLTLGSDPTCDIGLDDPYVSAMHAQLILVDGRCFVRDLDSRNGVFIGDQRIKEAEVPDGARVRIGKTLVQCTRATAGPRAGPEQSPLFGVSRAMAHLRQLIERIAKNSAPVLITGETGTGKEIAARLLVELSPRAAEPYQTINCGALSGELIASELFGHEKGAFTGALARKLGAFELAHRGSLFLDEIGELPLELQAHLLRAVEYGEIRRLGGSGATKVDVRLLAATNRHLAQEAADGRFREDLFHRLNVLTLTMPPLRERMEDIPELVRHFVSEATSGATVQVSPAALTRLSQHRWPGNVRELRNTVHRAVLMRQTDTVEADDIVITTPTLTSRVEVAGAVSERPLRDIERDAIIAELRRHGGNKTDAARALGISRSTIHRRIDEFAIDVEALVPEGR